MNPSGPAEGEGAVDAQVPAGGGQPVLPQPAALQESHGASGRAGNSGDHQEETQGTVQSGYSKHSVNFQILP